MSVYKLDILVREAVGSGSADLVTRPSGQIIRKRIEENLLNEKDGTAVVLDFSGIGIIDYSCADEVVAKLVSRLLAGEYGDKYIILAGLNENQKENIEVALERKNLAVLAEAPSGEKVLMGNLNNYLVKTLEAVMNRKTLTAKDLSEMMNLEANTSGTRLLNLYKKRLVRRTESGATGGRLWIYESL
jgi:hypothetical protein